MLPFYTSSRTYGRYLIYIAPLAIIFVFFVIGPILLTCTASLMRDVAFSKTAFIGFDNFQRLFSDSTFRDSVMFTLFFVAVSVPIEMVLGFMAAYLLHYDVRRRRWLNICLLLPWAIPAVVSARIWELVFNYRVGVANALCTALGLPGAPYHWLGTAKGAFFAVVLADVWRTVPFVAVILLAGLKSIPVELDKQARVDGASSLQRCLRITLPLLAPIGVVAALFRSADALRIFDLVYVLTHGGPGGATTSFSLYAYNYYLLGDFGYGSAVSVALFVLTFCLSILYIRAGRFKEALYG